MASVGSKEIEIGKEEITETINNLNNISVRLKCCKNQKFLLEKSVGETVTQAKNMYDEVLYVVGAMQELVDQTVELLENTIKSFEAAEEQVISKYIEKI